MPKRTLKKTLEICRDLWAWCAETGDGKRWWPSWKVNGGRIGLIEGDSSHCPCCEYIETHRMTCPSDCPLHILWPAGCCAPDSAYERWKYTRGQTRRKYAAVIRDAAAAELKKLE